MDVSIDTSRGGQEAHRGIFKTTPFQQSRGMTLIELMIVLTVIAIMTGIGIPGYQSLTASNRMSASVNQLRGALALTRSEAAYRNQHVAICHSPDGLQCSRRGNWSDGWIIFTDKNRNRLIDDSDEILHVYQTVNKSIAITYGAFGTKHYLVYRPSGFTRTNGTFTVCSPLHAHLKRALILTKSGRVRLSKVRADGTELVCIS